MKKFKYDFIVIGVLVIAVVIGFGISCIYQSRGEYVEVVIDGQVTETYPLNDDGEYTIVTDDGTNIILIENGQISMKEADCPDGLCIKQGKISKDEQSIICLPHKLVVRVISDQEDSVDAHTN